MREAIMSRPHFLFSALIISGALALASPGANAFQLDSRLAVDGQTAAPAVVLVSGTAHKKAKLKLQAYEMVPLNQQTATGGYNPCPQCPYGCSWSTPKVCWKN
jgi:hypothetical protein